jgi:hypothetical protein
MNEQFYAVTKDKDGGLQLMGGPYNSRSAALAGGEMNLLNTWGSKHKGYTTMLNNMSAINDSEKEYLKLS